MAGADDAGEECIAGKRKQPRDCNSDAARRDVEAGRRAIARIRILTIVLVSRSVELDMRWNRNDGWTRSRK